MLKYGHHAQQLFGIRLHVLQRDAGQGLFDGLHIVLATLKTCRSAVDRHRKGLVQSIQVKSRSCCKTARNWREIQSRDGSVRCVPTSAQCSRPTAGGT